MSILSNRPSKGKSKKTKTGRTPERKPPKQTPPTPLPPGPANDPNKRQRTPGRYPVRPPQPSASPLAEAQALRDILAIREAALEYRTAGIVSRERAAAIREAALDRREAALAPENFQGETSSRALH